MSTTEELDNQELENQEIENHELDYQETGNQEIENQETGNQVEDLPDLESMIDLLWKIKLNDEYTNNETGYPDHPLFWIACKLSPKFKKEYNLYIFNTKEYAENYYNDDDQAYSYACSYTLSLFDKLKKHLKKSKLITRLKQTQVFKYELLIKVDEYLFHPDRVVRFLENGWITFGEDGFAETLALEKNIPNYS